MNLYSRLTVDWILPVCAFLVIALPNLNHAPSYDEILHYDAAIGLSESGNLSIAQGTYRRAALYTALVAASFQAFGVSDIAARIPAVIASLIWSLLLYSFVRRIATRSAAWICLAVFLSAPTIIGITQMCRFYSLHGMFFSLAAILMFAMVYTRSGVRRIGMGIICLVSLAISFHLQATTFIGVGALLMWLIFLSVPSILALARRWPTRVPAAGLFSALMIALGFFLIPWSHFVDRALTTPLWSADHATQYVYYLRSLRSDFGFILLLFPFLTVIGYRQRPDVIWYACVILGVGLLLHSLAAQKAARYISYILPFVCIVAGIAGAELLSKFRQISIEFSRQVAGSRVPERVAATAIVSICVGFVILTNPNMAKALIGPVDVNRSSLAARYSRIADWREAQNILIHYADSSPTLVASSGPKALFYLGYYDYELNLSVVYETKSTEEFGVDGRTGGLVIGNVESLALVISCSPDGLAVFDESKWRKASHISPTVADFIEQAMERASVPSRANLRVYRWTRPPNDSAECETLQRSRSTMTH